MSWNFEWGGRASDFDPSHIDLKGKGGPVASAASSAVYESLQVLCEKSASTWVRVTSHGWEDKEPGLGQFTMMVQIVPEPSELEDQIAKQQPVDLTS